MIFDSIKNRKLYEGMHSGIKLGFDFIEKVINEGAEVGKYEIDGKNVYAMVQEYVGKENHEKFEAHKNYADIQFVLSGREIMESTKTEFCSPMNEYNPEKDVQHFTCNGLKTVIEAGENDFAIFFPDDVHKPGIRYAEGESIRKVVVKVKL